MTHSYQIIRLAVLLLCCLALAGCTQMRTEFYRNETGYLYELGCSHYKQGEYEVARTVLEELIKLDPDYGPAYAVLGNLAMIDEQYELAASFYQQAIDHDPELEKQILPFLLISNMHKIRKPLTDSGVDLAVVYPLMMDEKIQELEIVLEQDIPMELLARDSVSITPGQLGELRTKAAQLAPEMEGYDNLQIFTAYLLFYGDGNESIAKEVLSKMIQSGSGSEKQEASILMGRIDERQGHFVAAVKWYRAAVQAGGTIEDVAHHLARIYQVDLETILPSKGKAQPEKADAGNDNAVRPAPSVIAAEKRSRPVADDETEFSLPKPYAVLITSPR